MNNETAKMVQKAFATDLGADFTLLEIKAMKQVEPNGIDDEVYTLVDSEGMLFVARVFKEQNGKIYNILVKDMSLSRIDLGRIAVI